MRIRRRFWLALALLEASLFLGAVWFEPTCHVRGTLRGEAFFDGKPTSWWRRELGQWEADTGFSLTVHIAAPRLNQPFWYYQRHPTWFDQLNDRGWRF